MNIDNNQPLKTLKLKDHEILDPFLEYLAPTCIDLKPGEELTVYRTQNHVPVDDYGESPRPRRKYGANAIKQKLSSEEVKALPPRKRDKIMGEWGLSCNDSEESARQNFIYTYEFLKKKGASKSDLESFVEERGVYICRYTITCEAGLITPFDEHGHANFYLYEDVNLEDLRDKEYNYKTIDYPSNED